MALRRLAKDAGSSKGGCPSVYIDDEDVTQMTVQGPDRGTDGLIEVIPGETGVRVPAETVIRAARRYLAEHPEMDPDRD